MQGAHSYTVIRIGNRMQRFPSCIIPASFLHPVSIRPPHCYVVTYSARVQPRVTSSLEMYCRLDTLTGLYTWLAGPTVNVLPIEHFG
jgi:hypothetical protein